MFMKRFASLVFIVLPTLFFSSCVQSHHHVLEGKEVVYDLSVEATVYKVKPITAKTTVDAVESLKPKKEEPPLWVVYFTIDRVLKGHLTTVKIQPPSKWSQMQEAIKYKEYHKIALQDYKSVPTEVERKRFRIAMHDPYKKFGIPTIGVEPEPWKYRLYFKRYKLDEHTYVLSGFERI